MLIEFGLKCDEGYWERREPRRLARMPRTVHWYVVLKALTAARRILGCVAETRVRRWSGQKRDGLERKRDLRLEPPL